MGLRAARTLSYRAQPRTVGLAPRLRHPSTRLITSPPPVPPPPQAEAQCAYLEIAGLVDGVVTDDNDVFLFGGRHVYRHIFENKKWAPGAAPCGLRGAA